MIRWQVVQALDGTIRIDEMEEDRPLMTFHGVDAEKTAALVLRGLRALEAYGDVIPT